MNPIAKRKVSFVVAPDIIGDPIGTLQNAETWLPKIRSYGFKVALAAQDGLQHMQDDIPFGEFDVFFIGGSTPFKHCRNVNSGRFEPKIVEMWDSVKHRKIPIHMGRVNSEKRLNMNSALGGSSADGTFLKHGDKINLPKLVKWLDHYNSKEAQDARINQLSLGLLS